MLVALEQARSMALFAAVTAADEDAVERRRAIAAAKVQIGRSGRHVGQEAIQLHGGIGMTMKYKVGHYFKRMTMIDKMFGDADVHLETLARLGGLFGNTKAAASYNSPSRQHNDLPTRQYWRSNPLWPGLTRPSPPARSLRKVQSQSAGIPLGWPG